MLSATTELEAVNLLLEMVEEAPVNTLSGSLDPDAAAALTTIRERSRVRQAPGWEFNREPEYTLSLGNDGYIQVPADIATVQSIDGTRLAIRGGRLFNRDANTFRFDADVKVFVIFRRDFADLPEAFRTYVLVDACLSFLARRGGGELLAKVTASDLNDAREEAVAEDIRAGAYSMNHNPAIQSRPRK